MEKEDLMNGLGFVMGTLDILDSRSFLRKIHRELSEFLKVSKSDREVRQFQSKLYQSLEVLRDFSSLISDDRDTKEDNMPASQQSR